MPKAKKGKTPADYQREYYKSKQKTHTRVAYWVPIAHVDAFKKTAESKLRRLEKQ